MERKTTKEILAESFYELAGKKRIDKITIKDITDNCGYSSATFYRHFKDKYDLIGWAYSLNIEKIMDQYAYDRVSWKQALYDAASYCEAHREYLANLLRHTTGHDAFVHSMIEAHYNCLRRRILKAEGSEVLDEQMEMFLRIYIHGSIRLACEWILGQYKCGIEELVEVCDNSLPPSLRKVLYEE